MTRIAAYALCALITTAQAADAGGMGRFLSGLLTRGAVSATVHGLRDSNTLAKSYTPDILTVDQLVQCLKRATSLDQEFDGLESMRKELQISSDQIDPLKAQLEKKAAVVNRSNKEMNVRNRQELFNYSVNAHNISANSYNAACAKKYYADDMEQARKLAGI